MMTVNEVSKLTGVSAHTLQQILLFRELEFPLKDIREIIGSPDFDRGRALEQQIELLKLKKEHIEIAARMEQPDHIHSFNVAEFSIKENPMLCNIRRTIFRMYAHRPCMGISGCCHRRYDRVCMDCKYIDEEAQRY